MQPILCQANGLNLAMCEQGFTEMEVKVVLVPAYPWLGNEWLQESIVIGFLDLFLSMLKHRKNGIEIKMWDVNFSSEHVLVKLFFKKLHFFLLPDNCVTMKGKKICDREQEFMTKILEYLLHQSRASSHEASMVMAKCILLLADFRTLHQKDFLDYEFVTKEYPRVYFPNLLLEFYVNPP